MKTVYTILLNWNGWRDTIHCLESVLRSDYPDYRVILCDNNSTDGSLEKIKAWAEGRFVLEDRLNDQLDPLIFPAVAKPVTYIEYTREDARSGDREGDESTPLVLIQTGSNGGYSAGNNVGIRYALEKKADYVWLLNNDTVIRKDTLRQLIDHVDEDDALGLAGAMIYFASEPGKIQTIGGGTIAPFTGLDRFVQAGKGIDYVTGTSLLVKGTVFQDVGLLDDGFFFYWEDVDFSRRAAAAGWKMTYAEKAVVYHKFSATVGSASLKSDLFKAASLVRFFKKHQRPLRWLFPVVFNIGGMLVNRLLRGQWKRIFPIAGEAFRGMKKRI